MMPSPLRLNSVPLRPDLSADEGAIARSVLYAALFDYPLTLAQLRRTLIGSTQTPSQILATLRTSVALGDIVDQADGYFFPAGRRDLIDVRRSREARSRGFLDSHGLLLRTIAALPYVRMLALSGSVAHLNLEQGGDLDIFLVTRGRRVWSTTVIVVLLAKLLGRRRTLCANFVVADTALHFAQADLFTANQIVGLKTVTGADVFQTIVRLNPFVRAFYPNFHGADSSPLRIRHGAAMRLLRRSAEVALWAPSAVFELVCRTAYRSYLRRRASTWTSPDQVTLGDAVVKLHTRSHRHEVLSRFDEAVSDTLD